MKCLLGSHPKINDNSIIYIKKSKTMVVIKFLKYYMQLQFMKRDVGSELEERNQITGVSFRIRDS